MKKNKKDARSLKKMYKQCEKELKHLVKEFTLGDFWLYDFLEVFIKYWIEYYKLGCVYCSERKDVPEFNMPNAPTRLEICLKLKEIFDTYMNFEYEIIEDKWVKNKSVEEINQEFNKRRKALFDFLCEYGNEIND